jgi:hypothetical protein
MQVQSECHAELLVEFCRRDGARRYPLNRGVRCGSVDVRTGAPVGARPSENGNRLSLRPVVWASYDGAPLSPISRVRAGGCHPRARSVQLLLLPIFRRGACEVGTIAKASETRSNHSSSSRQSRPRRPLAFLVIDPGGTLPVMTINFRQGTHCSNRRWLK